MTINERVIAAVEQFNLPVSPQVYTGDAAWYFVFDITIGDTVDGDNEPYFVYYQVSLSLFSPARADTVELCEATQQAIVDAGFTFPSLSPGTISLDGARKEQVLTFGRWEEWLP